jgi:hypothetical protein
MSAVVDLFLCEGWVFHMKTNLGDIHESLLWVGEGGMIGRSSAMDTTALIFMWKGLNWARYMIVAWQLHALTLERL